MATPLTSTLDHPRQVQAFSSSDDLLCTKCQRCKRRLRSIPSRRVGYGPTCAKRMGIDFKAALASVVQPGIEVAA